MSFKNSVLNQGIMPCTQLSSNFLMSFLAEGFQLTSPQPCGCPLIFFFFNSKCKLSAWQASSSNKQGSEGRVHSGKQNTTLLLELKMNTNKAGVIS